MALAAPASPTCSRNAAYSTDLIGRSTIAMRYLRFWHAIFPVPSNPPLQSCWIGARRPQHRIWANGAPFALKDTLKQRGYRWNDGADGHPKSWYIDTDIDVTDAELDYLRKEILQRKDANIVVRMITSLDRFLTA
jgi:hypothetical protein